MRIKVRQVLALLLVAVMVLSAPFSAAGTKVSAQRTREMLDAIPETKNKSDVTLKSSPAKPL